VRPTRLAPVACLALTASALILTGTPAPATAAAGPFTAMMEARETVEPTRLTLEELTLDRIFPDESVFGPSASGMAFSADGRYAAWLYRPAAERRHGNDLWLLDTASGEVERLTSVSVMREFQASTRKVSEDRIAKAKKRGDGGKADGNGRKQGNGDEAAPPADDGVSGTWTGTMTGDDELVGDGMEIVLTVRMGDDGRIEGTAQTALGTATITEGRFRDGTLDCLIVEPESGMRIRLRARISGSSLSGQLTVEGEDIELTISAERTEIGRGLDTESDAGGADSDDGDSDGDGDGGDTDEDGIDLGDTVGDDDAKDRRAPRYGGIQSFTWHPEGGQMIITSGGDLYRMDVDDRSMTRLTMTQEPERGVAWLPDGGGYTYLSGSSIKRVRFGDHVIEQMDPNLPSGESLGQFRISPDGRFYSFVTTRGTSWFGAGQQVTLVDYRGRFARARQVTRHMPNDPIPDFEYRFWVYDSAGHRTEQGELVQVHAKKLSGPRDRVQVPEWAPDSSRAVFATFDQATSMVEILETRIPARAEDADPDAPVKAEVARPIYRFAHTHGPNTPERIRPWYLADSRRVTFIAEMSGFRHLHVLDPLYESLTQLTEGRYEVYPFAMSEDHTRLFVSATKEHPSREDVYEVDLETGDMRRLTLREGVYSGAAVSDDGRWVLANHIDFGSLRELHLIDTEAGGDRAMTDSHDDEARILTTEVPTYFTFENRHGQEIHGHYFLPDDWTPEDKRPLLLYVYGGPLGTRNMITRGSYAAPSYFFAMYMARKHGWVTATVDPRGASGFGGLFEKANFEQVGKPQAEDLVDATKWLVANAGVDEKRMAMHGWSFGGFQTQMTLYTEPDVFAAGIAGAGPTEWKNYNTWYTTGTVGERWGERDMPDGPSYSLIPLAKNLKARLLLVHGMEDSNVLYQDTVKVYQALLQAGKEALVDLFLDPTGGHGLGGDVKTIGRYRKYEGWLLDVIGSGNPPADANGDADTED
jgi:dipeptidyl aminopeptidase/acylaminoacyl peptidase